MNALRSAASYRAAVAIRPLTTTALCVALGACSGLPTRNADGHNVRMSREEFEAYAEKTFRYHNSMVNELIMTSSLGDEDFEFSDAVQRAEEDMAVSCQPLNDMVSATIEGRELSFWRKLRLLQQVPECEAATRRVDRMLNESQ